MESENEILGRHLLDLARRAESQNVYTFSDFLGLSGQDAFSRVIKQVKIPYSESGGIDGCERVMIRFGDCEEWGYEVPFPIVCLHITPKEEKFADRMTHRDYLGALLNLGISRETLGDIVVKEREAYLFCEEKIAPFILEHLARVKHTDINVQITENLPTGELFKTEKITVTITSERIDALLSKVYNLPREEAKNSVEKGLVFVDGKEVLSPSFSPRENSVISLRGVGRFIYRGVFGNSKKGKDVITIEKYV